MILPMKKISLLVLDTEKRSALTELRKLGLVHIEDVQGSSEKLTQLKEQASAFENAVFAIQNVHNKKDKVEPVTADADKVCEIVNEVTRLSEENKEIVSKISHNLAEIERVIKWGDFKPEDMIYLEEKGIYLYPYEMPLEAYKELTDEVQTILVNTDKTTARFLVVSNEEISEKPEALPESASIFERPKKSISQMNEEVKTLQADQEKINKEIDSYYKYTASINDAVKSLQKDIVFENYESGMEQAEISDDLKIAYLNGYIPTEDLDKLQAAAKKHGWGIVAEDPTIEDNVPTKLRNNKFVSLIYPLTDFLGTVPGYFEYDISGWFLGFMLIFFGMIFGDGGYGLLIAGVAVALIIKAKTSGQEVQPLYLLVGLFGLATMLWGLVTCTWFGLPIESIPTWLQNLSVPVLSNVNEAKIWQPFWVEGEIGLTTAQNLQIFCFTLALIQLTVAHLKAGASCLKSLRLIGEIGNILQLWGMFYVVLTLVVNAEVFGLGRVINGIPVGTVSITLVAVGFVMSFIFGSYEGSVKDSVLDSLKNIISILLGVVNVFSDIVSYIRLWAVGLAGAAISQTVNEMAGGMLGNLALILVVVILLVFGHGLNMILNLLSVIVHGVRLNTLEFSTHLGMAWSGHKYEPFDE
ncbi:V-type ATP synthase subunit I [Lachnospiraceae bacterium TWA4]|nr:V-type ATP synthase subunit I [Lachnospiraceae bacterium TWA4]